MKPHGALVLVGLSLLALASAGAYGNAASRAPRGNLDNVGQPAPPSPAEGGVYSVDPYPRYGVTLAPGDGRVLVETFCSACHSTRYITMQPPLPAEKWEAEVNKMIHTFGMPIPEEAATEIIRYLQTHYTPETRQE